MYMMLPGMQVCYYRDKNSINKFQVAKVTTEGVDICEPFALETNWDLKVSSAVSACVHPLRVICCMLRLCSHTVSCFCCSPRCLCQSLFRCRTFLSVSVYG